MNHSELKTEKMKNQNTRAQDYHQRTKHHLGAYARGPEGLDWDHQPDPFRRFDDCPRIALPLKARELNTTYEDLFIPHAVPPKSLCRENIALLCELSMGLSAWKVYGSSRWSLRCNPSSGNLHPTEGYLLLPETRELDAGVYHYLSHDHVLEQRCKLGPTVPELLPAGSFLMGLSSIHWREVWKYGERAYRYCQLDTGHLIGGIRYAAACLGWNVTLQGNWDDDAIATVFGLHRKQDFAAAEQESPDVVLLIESLENDTVPTFDISTLTQACRNGQWQGQANVLSAEHDFTWPIIDDVSQACFKPKKEDTDYTIAAPLKHTDIPGILQPDYLKTQKASEIIRQRRSAQVFDGTSPLPFSVFCRMLDALLPRNDTPPFDVGFPDSRVHLVFFVHRVEGLNPGLYCLPRSQSGEALLREEFNDQFQWQKLENVPDAIPLFLLVRARCGQAAHTLSCHQSIAADSAFSLAMIAEFEKPLEAGDWVYRHLFWEAGLIGQSLYLEAEAAGVRGTGIGCYFDDKVHETLGITNTRLQDLYHFTVGTPQLDSRMGTQLPYAHLEPRDP